MQNFLNQQNFGGGGEGGDLKDDNQPWYVKYGIRALGTIAGGAAILCGVLGVPFSILSPMEVFWNIWLALVGFVVVTIEAPFCCAFVDKVQILSRKIEDKPIIVKAALYVLAPLPSILFAFDFNTFIGGGLVLGVGVLYGMIGIGKKASREEMARNAQIVGGVAGDGSSSNSYQQQPEFESAKNPFSTINLSRDPVQAAAAAWASQSISRFEPPPPYKSSTSATPHRNWDQSFVNEPKTNPSDPSNPFQ